jgi:hypothetical protein
MFRKIPYRLAAAAFLAAFFVLAVVAYVYSNSFQQCLHLLEVHNALITAISTALLTFVTAGLVWVGYQQVRTTRFQLRAYVFPDSAALVDGTMLNPPIPIHANVPGVVLLWKNTGQTPAANVVSWAQIAVIEPINEHTLVVPPLRNIFATHLGANASGTKSLWFNRPLTPNEIGDVQAGARAICIYGRIEYRDIFEKKRWTNFRLAYSGPFPPPPGVIFNVCDKGNDAH